MAPRARRNRTTRLSPARLLAAPAALLALAGVAPGAQAGDRAHRVAFGYSDTAEAFLQATRAVRRSESTGARIMVYWPEVDEHPELEPAVARLQGLGIDPVLSVWGLHVPDPEAYAATCADLARRFPEATIELWNEPNILLFGAIEPTLAASIFGRAYTAIREVNPTQRIIGPSIAPVGKDWKGYGRALYSLLPPDVEVGLHLYPRSAEPIPQLRGALRRFAQLQRPIDVTETAIIRTGRSRAEQVELTERAYEVISAARRVRSVYFHRLLYPPANTHLDDVWQTYAIDGEGHYTDIWRALRTARRAAPAP